MELILKLFGFLKIYIKYKFYLNGSLHYSRIIFNYFLVRNEQCGQFNERDGDRTLWEGTQQLMVNLDRGNRSA